MKREQHVVQICLAIFLTTCAILLFYDTLFARRVAVTFTVKLLDALAPILYGALMAYLLAPVVDYFERKLFPAAVRRARERGALCARGPRFVSLTLTWLLIGVLVYLLLLGLLPELYRSIILLVGNLENYYRVIQGWINNLLEQNPQMESWVSDLLDSYYNDLIALLTQRVMPQAQQIMSAVSGGIITAINFLKNLLVGMIVSIYLLAAKEICAAHSRKLVYGLFPRTSTPWILRGAARVNVIFSGFVRGKLLDSLIIGIICFFGCSLLNMPYTPLVAVIVGVTNVIPFFGPFLGAVPSLFLILLVEPLKALYFLIFVLLLQQADGNIIGPKILGGTTGLSGLWIITAILVGGSFFGVIGMFFAVPVFACFYTLITFLVNLRLKRNGLPVSMENYVTAVPPKAESSAPDAEGDQL